MIKKFFLTLLASTFLISLQAMDLDLDHAVYRALSYSPALDIAHNESESNRSLVRQASYAPNPILSYEIENFAGNNEWRGWNPREERYNWSQLFETAGKRDLRTQAASYQYYASLVGFDVSKLVVLNKLYRAFVNVVTSQEMLEIAKDQAAIAHELLRVVTKKIEAEKVSPIQKNKAQVQTATAEITINNAEVNLKNAKRRLSLIWAEPIPDFERVNFDFFTIQAPIPLDECLANLSHQAEVVQQLYTFKNAEKTWDLEKANRIPDVTLQVGYKANYQENNQGLIAGVYVPIPLFNQNQGNVGRAYYDMLKTEDQGRQLWKVLESKLSITYEDLMRAYVEAEKIRTHSLPAATESFDLAQKGYLAGKFEYIDVLDAQRTLYDVKASYIQALMNYHTRRADIDFLNSQTE